MSTDGALEPVPAGPLVPNSALSSAPNRVKFMCSYGGRILPRPVDGHLKYVGGETRVISVLTDVTLQDLMKKLTFMVDGEMILKYQVFSEDLDALVSVKSDEDLHHMLDEIDRYERAGSRLRAFLFPRNPVVMESPSGLLDHHAPEQRYIDSINGILIPSPLRFKQHPVISNMQCSSRTSSACSSPRSLDSYTGEATNAEFLLQTNQPKSGLGMHRVRSSPSISSLSNVQQSNHHVHPCYQNSRQPQLMAGYQSLKPPLDSHKTVVPERLYSTRSVGRVEGLRYQVEPIPQQYQYALKQNRGTGCFSKWMAYDDCGQFRDKGSRSLAGSPNSMSPRYSHGGMKWDSSTSREMRGE